MTEHDVEDRLAAEAAVRFQAQLLNAVGQAVIAADPRGTIVYWNRAAEHLYGWSAAEAIGRPVLELIPTEESAEQGAEILELLTRGLSWTGDFLARAKNGARLLVLATNTPVIDDDGQLVAVIGVTADITERKRAERGVRAAARQR